MSVRASRCRLNILKFGDVVKNVNLVERNPEKNCIDRIVGLEHIDPQNLHIKRWNLLQNGSTSFTRKFLPGQTLFGKRRAYQRKVAFAEFEGLCSGDILTLEPMDRKVLLPELLPFICKTDAFFDYALGTSAGSLSPRTSWSALKDFKFSLPSIKDQKRIAEILWAADEVNNKNILFLDNSRKFRNKFLYQTLEHGYILNLEREELPPKWVHSKIGAACKIVNNLRKPISASIRSHMQGKYPYYGPTGILDYINEYRVDGEYVLIGEDGDHFLKFDQWDMTQLVKGKFNVNNHAHLLAGTEVCRTKWIYYYFKHRDLLPYLSRQGAGRLKLNKSTLELLPIVLPPVEEQDKLCEVYIQIESSLSECEKQIESSAMLIKELINNTFGAHHV